MSIFHSHSTRLFLTALAAFTAFGGPVAAQTFITRSQEIRLGFYAGRTGYFGDYNPGPLGQPFVYGLDRKSPAAAPGLRDNNFGSWLKLPLNSTFGLLFRGDFGSLTYEDAGLKYRMATPFSAFSAGFEINPLHSFMVQPYLTAAAGMMRYSLPPAIPDPDLDQYSPGAFRQKAQAVYVPVTLGVAYPLSVRTTVFAEYGFNLTNADNLDNLALPPAMTQSSLGNDAFGGFRIGMHVAIMQFFDLKRNRKSVRRPVYPQEVPMEAFSVEMEKLRPLKMVPADTLRRYWEAMKDAQKNDLARMKADPVTPPVAAPVVAAVVPLVKPAAKKEEPPKKIAVAKPPEERVFKQEAEKEKVQQVTIDRKKAREEARAAEAARLASGEIQDADASPAPSITDRPTAQPVASKKELKNVVDRTDPTLYTDETDPFIPKLMIRPRAIPDEIIVDGFVTRDPPVGYYVQVYATVGPISAQRARQRTIEVLKEYLEDAESQVIITQRRQFYEVRIGVFDTYDDTISVLEQVLGIYYDAYSLIYLTDSLQ